MSEKKEKKNVYIDKVFTIPNILSFVRLCLIPIIIWLYIVGEYVFSGIVLIVSGLTDMVDGFIARHFNMISNVGKVLDPFADKLTQVAVISCLIAYHPLIALPLGLIIAKEAFMLIIGFIVIKRTKKVFGARWHGKVATCLLDAMIIMHIFWGNIPKIPCHISILVCSAAIIVSFILYGVQCINSLKQEKKERLAREQEQIAELKSELIADNQITIEQKEEVQV